VFKNKKLSRSNNNLKFSEEITFFEILNLESEHEKAVALTSKGNIYLIDLTTEEIIEEKKVLGEHFFNFGKIVPFEQNKAVVLNTEEKNIGLLDIMHKNVFINSFEILTDSPCCMDFSQTDNNTLGVITSTGIIDLFDVRDLNKISHKSASFKGHNGIGKSITFPFNNEFCFCTSDDNEIVLWDKRNFSKRCYTLEKNNIESIQFRNSDNFQLIISLENKIEIFDFGEVDGEDEGVKFLYMGHTFPGIQIKQNKNILDPLFASTDFKSRSLHIWQLTDK
jgi:WD40 repeat protein